MIQIKDLTVILDKQTIFSRVNLSFADNKKTVVVGKSGCGKTVLIKAIEMLIPSQGGTIEVDDVNIFALSLFQIKQMRKKIAMLFQSSALLDSLNVYQNIALPLFEHRAKELKETQIRKIVHQKLELVGLTNIMNKMPSELSGGMKKRVALARAIILEPKYIIYDEPTTGLDPATSSEIITLINKIHKKGDYTSIIITHDQDCIKQTAERVIHIYDTKVEEFEDPSFFDYSIYFKD